MMTDFNRPYNANIDSIINFKKSGNVIHTDKTGQNLMMKQNDKTS